ncbi:hypothetical protein BABINDRAFT_81227 [Babjeviella inositovora NRRL Y-12698]|uniref:Conserved oligomeric Golgi complex subunit 8 n=1 Tax=Babjeviella inositovora NRRL Y-12698 TaxID=984486 RepID=A0A1E3QZL6_9ASCO|nr:uncharacterized protein BABINDRAFT_81227 [Babjeviella inositovora NRRL Y-12698]ODQ83129.1 hypothetical protein BABINDRAFT_81227 [Babjeviella inositovora NRRL Y-12698]
MPSNSLDLLLETLSEDMSPEMASLLADPAVHADCVVYLDTLFSSLSDLLLSSLPPSMSDTGTTQETHKTIVEEIAELSSKQRSLEARLKECTVSKSLAIVESSVNLFTFYEGFQTKFDNKMGTLQTEIKAVKSQKWKQPVPESKLMNVDSTINILNNLPLLTDLLELPSLIKICIKQGNYLEALEINLFIKRLLIRFSSSEARNSHISILHKIQRQVALELNEMMLGLLNLLSNDLKQSSLVKTMGILAKLQPFLNSATHNELKVIYFNARINFIMKEFSYLQPLLKTKTIQNLEKYLKRSIEIVREYGYSTIATYQGIFPNSDDSVYVHNFLQTVLTALLHILVAELPVMLVASPAPGHSSGSTTDAKTLKDGLLLQLYYCLLSLSRVGGQSFQFMFVNGLVDREIMEEEEWAAVEEKVNKNRVFK